jgi:hypothetical protein
MRLSELLRIALHALSFAEAAARVVRQGAFAIDATSLDAVSRLCAPPHHLEGVSRRPGGKKGLI